MRDGGSTARVTPVAVPIGASVGDCLLHSQQRFAQILRVRLVAWDDSSYAAHDEMNVSKPLPHLPNAHATGPIPRQQHPQNVQRLQEGPWLWPAFVPHTALLRALRRGR